MAERPTQTIADERPSKAPGAEDILEDAAALPVEREAGPVEGGVRPGFGPNAPADERPSDKPDNPAAAEDEPIEKQPVDNDTTGSDDPKRDEPVNERPAPEAQALGTEDTKREEPEEPKAEQPKAEQPKHDEPKHDEPKSEEPKDEVEERAAEDSISPEPAPEPPTAEQAPAPQAPEQGPAEPSDADPGELDEAVLEADDRADRSDDADNSSSSADITDAIPREEADIDVVPDRPEDFHDDPGFQSGAATEHHQDLLPSDEESPSEDDDGSPGSGGDGAPSVDLGTIDPAIGAVDESDDEGDDPFDLDPTLDGTLDTGRLTEHEQGIIDDLAGDPFADPLNDPVVTGEEVPDEYDLSGNEAGDGGADGGDQPWLLDAIDWLTQPASGGEREVQPSQSNPFPDHKYVEGEGWVPLEEGEEDPDRTNLGESRAESMAEAAEQEEEEPVDYGDVDVIDWVVSWFEDDEVDDGAGTTEDRGPDSAPAPKSPTLDPEIADTHFGIGVEAERNSEIQYADMPGSGDDETTEYDGVDYGDNHTEPNFDIREAEELIYIDVFDQPDVDPSEHDDGAESGNLDDAMLE